MSKPLPRIYKGWNGRLLIIALLVAWTQCPRVDYSPTLFPQLLITNMSAGSDRSTDLLTLFLLPTLVDLKE